MLLIRRFEPLVATALTIVVVTAAMFFTWQRVGLRVAWRPLQVSEEVTLYWLSLPLLAIFYASCALVAWIALRGIWTHRSAEETPPPWTPGAGRRASAIVLALAAMRPVLSIAYFPTVPGVWGLNDGINWPALAILLASCGYALAARRFEIAAALPVIGVTWFWLAWHFRYTLHIYDGC